MSMLPASPGFEARLLRALENGRLALPRNGVRVVETTPLDTASWYASYRSKLVVEDGRDIGVFLKDFDDYDRPKEDLEGRRDRERVVYRDLLDPRTLGTPRYYGSVWEDQPSCHWLLLEFVDGRLVKHLPLASWMRAAGWLARLHAHAARTEPRLRTAHELLDIDESGLTRQAEQAVRTAQGVDQRLAQRLRSALQVFVRCLAILRPLPETLVHGAYRPHNILERGDGTICPVDWELAARGPVSYDIAFLTDGFDGDEYEAFLETYLAAADEHGVDTGDRGAFAASIRVLQMHLAFLCLQQPLARGYRSEDLESQAERIDELREQVQRTDRASSS